MTLSGAIPGRFVRLSEAFGRSFPYPRRHAIVLHEAGSHDHHQPTVDRRPASKGNPMTCRLCGQPEAVPICTIRGRFSGRAFDFYRCSDCAFIFIGDPWVDYGEIYNEQYYAGKGADPLVDYLGEVDNSERTIRRLEWRGIFAYVASLTEIEPTTTWLDYGCGAGGLVSFLREKRNLSAVGFEQGWSVPRLVDRHVPFITEGQLADHDGQFDVVTAIEVIEHTVDPVAELRRMRRLLKPSGLLFMTTGNVGPYRDRLAKWRYVVPEVHISYFEPQTLAFALRRAGFTPEFPGYGPGWTDIIRFKILKALHRKSNYALDNLAPWSVLCRLTDWRLRVAAQPVGRAK